MSDLRVQEPQQQVINDFPFQVHICTHTAAIITIQSVCLGYAPELEMIELLWFWVIFVCLLLFFFTELMHF